MAEGLGAVPHLALIDQQGPVPGLRYFDYPGTHCNHLLAAVRTAAGLEVYMVRLKTVPRRYRRLRAPTAEMERFLASALVLPGRAEGQWPVLPELYSREAFRRHWYQCPICAKKPKKTIARRGA